MRILIASTHRTLVGGIETYLRDVIPELRARGHSVALLSSAAADAVGPPIVSPGSDVPAWSLAAADGLRAAGDWGPELVFLHGLDDPDDEEALVDRYPTVLFAHGHTATCISGSRTHTFPTGRPCERRFGPACLVHYLPRGCGGRNPLTMIRLYRRTRHRSGLFPRYAAVVVAGRALADEYRSHGVPDERLHRIPLFPTGVTSDPAPGTRPGTGRVLMLGRLYPEKGTRLIVEAVGRAAHRLGRGLTLVVAGDGPDRPRIEAAAARLGLPIESHPWVGPDDRTTLMRGADVLVVPSVCPETFGLVGVEAGCVGLPAVGFAVGGLPDWLRPGVSGELAPADPPTADGLAVALCRALADPGHLNDLAAGAWRTAQEFSRDAHVAALETILHRAAQSLPPVPV